jgi:hypothetical protein
MKKPWKHKKELNDLKEKIKNGKAGITKKGEAELTSLIETLSKVDIVALRI